ncbi:MAG: RNA 3'-terminal phosphate cyclase [Candidatus Aenigmatarchaeota archaeon]
MWKSKGVLLIELDGGGAGGQFVRTAVALSALTGKAVKIGNIRGARPEPGLKSQHIEGIYSIGELCNAKIAGLELGSQTLEFVPGKMEPHDLKIRISTAGSIGLVLQAVMLAIAGVENPITIDIKGGGTWGKWAPPVEYLKNVFFPLVGEKTSIEIRKEGFYPKGGAEVVVKTVPWKPHKIELLEAGPVEKLLGVSCASLPLARSKVAERQVDAAGMVLRQNLGKTLDAEIKYKSTDSTGSGMLVYAKTHNSIFGGDCIGELRKSAEEVGKEAAKNLIMDYATGAVDRHAADMLLPYMALAGEGKIKTPEITNHILTNASVIEKFLPVKFGIEGERGKPGTVSVSPA